MFADPSVVPTKPFSAFALLRAHAPALRRTIAVTLLGALALALVSTRAHAQLELGGTQPGELEKGVRPSSICADCHGGYADEAPLDAWQGTMMANAARDPLFLAALTIANQDVAGSGDLCLRCHTPRAWLAGRSKPTDGSALEPDDFDSVNCDFCHRLTSGPSGETLIGNGQFFVADDYVRRGPIVDPVAPHDSEHSPYFTSSELCGLCHDVSNPFQGGFAIERTYSEWKASAYPERNETCQTCHMPAREGKACGAPNTPDRIVHVHELAGGNWWMPRVLSGENPELGRAEAYEATSNAALAMLSRAAVIAIEAAPEGGRAGSDLAFVVRVENRTGHKLPTGYPEGRRCWLEVTATDEAGQVIYQSGAYDAATATRLEDEALRTYEVEMAADGEVGFHFVRQDELVEDTRIPPEGFQPADDTRPLGRDYEILDGGVLAHYDLAPYRVRLPENLRGTLTLRARLLYQTTSREYVEFLRDENRTDERGRHMHELWERYDRSPPVAMAEASVRLPIGPAPAGCSVGRVPSSSPRWVGLGDLTACLLFPMTFVLIVARRRRRFNKEGAR